MCEQEPIRIDQLIADDSNSTTSTPRERERLDGCKLVIVSLERAVQSRGPGALVRPLSVPVPHEMMNDLLSSAQLNTLGS